MKRFLLRFLKVFDIDLSWFNFRSYVRGTRCSIYARRAAAWIITWFVSCYFNFFLNTTRFPIAKYFAVSTWLRPQWNLLQCTCIKKINIYIVFYSSALIGGACATIYYFMTTITVADFIVTNTNVQVNKHKILCFAINLVKYVCFASVCLLC